MVWILVMVGIVTLYIIGLNLIITDLKTEIKSLERRQEAVRSPFVKCKTQNVTSIFFNGLLLIKQTDYNILAEGVLFKHPVMQDDIIVLKINDSEQTILIK